MFHFNDSTDGDGIYCLDKIDLLGRIRLLHEHATAITQVFSLKKIKFLLKRIGREEGCCKWVLLLVRDTCDGTIVIHSNQSNKSISQMCMPK